MARTIAEEAKMKNLLKVKAALLQKHITMGATELDLSLLPTETQVKVCVLRAEPMIGGGFDVHVTEEEGEVCAALGLRSNEITMRQANFLNVSPKDKTKVTTFTEEAGVEFTLPMLSPNRNDRRKVLTFLDGSSVNFLATAINEVYANSTFDQQQFFTHLEQHKHAYAFIGQHSIRFPTSFKDRDNVSFLGLPYGTIVPTKNGGQFKVLKRDAVVLGSDNVARGCLLMQPLDEKAAKIAQDEQWAVRMHNSTAGALVPDYLKTKKESTKFMVHNIEVPYKDLTEPFREYFGGPTMLKGGLLARATGPKVTFYNNQDDLRDALDDFLFG